MSEGEQVNGYSLRKKPQFSIEEHLKIEPAKLKSGFYDDFPEDVKKQLGIKRPRTSSKQQRQESPKESKSAKVEHESDDESKSESNSSESMVSDPEADLSNFRLVEKVYNSVPFKLTKRMEQKIQETREMMLSDNSTLIGKQIYLLQKHRSQRARLSWRRCLVQSYKPEISKLSGDQKHQTRIYQVEYLYARGS